jgi:hypothetical protein
MNGKHVILTFLKLKIKIVSCMEHNANIIYYLVN